MNPSSPLASSSSDAPGEKEERTMLAFSIASPGDSSGSVVRIPVPTPPPSFALVRVLRAGVCNTDLEILRGYMGFSGVLGHEFVGVVESVNTEDEEARGKWTGRRVCGDINVGCSRCGVCENADGLDDLAECSRMSRNHCPNRTVLGILNHNGTMAEYLTLPISNLHAVPDGMSDQVAVFAEPLAAAFRIPEQGLVRYADDCSEVGEGKGRRRRPDRVAILGDGKLGLMIAEVLGREHTSRNSSWTDANGATAPRPVLFGKHRQKMDLVSEAGVNSLPVSDCVDESAFGGVHSDHAARYDVVVDATGSPAGLKLAAGLCRPMGVLVLKSTCAEGEPFNAAPIVIDELRVVGSRCGPIDRALELLSLKEGDEGEVKPLRVEKYVTRTFPLSDAAEAVECAAERSTMKVQIVCSDR